MASELNMNLVTAALNGGEDYELLFTVPLTDHEKIAEMSGVRIIGHMTKPELGCVLSTRDDNEIQLKAQGWNAFSNKFFCPFMPPLLTIITIFALRKQHNYDIQIQPHFRRSG